MSYDVEGMKAAIKPDTIHVKNPRSTLNPSLGEFLNFGTVEELAAAVIEKKIPEPWWSLAVMNIPVEILLTKGVDYMLAALKPGKEEGK